MSHLLPRKIGIDLDNTLIDYSPSVRVFAKEEKIPGVDSISDLRSMFRHSDNEKWQHLQSRIYTQGLEHAVPSKASVDFLTMASSFGIQVSIVSHKTLRTPEQFGGIDLRTPVLAWLSKWEIVPKLIPESQVFFAIDQEEKIRKIHELKLDWFIDDLKEVLLHPKFPNFTIRWLYQPSEQHAPSSKEQSSFSHELPIAFSSFSHLQAILRSESEHA
jgi:hypothetical protein